MPLVIPGGSYEVSYHMSLVGSDHEAVCTIGVSYEGTDFFADKTALATAWNGVMAPLCSDWTYTLCRLRNQDGTTDEFALSTQGGTSATGMPPMVAYLVKKITGQPGRRRRGRMYLPGVTETAADGAGVISSGKQAEVGAALNTYVTTLDNANFTPVILHTIPVGSTDDPTPTPITAIALDAKVATQRRRMR